MKLNSKVHKNLRVVEQNGRRGLFAVGPIAKGEVLIDLQGEELLPSPTRESLQVDESSHVIGREETIGYLNHACQPSARLDDCCKTVIALRNLAAGEEITVNYLATEYDMHENFRCDCESPECFGLIRGFRYLSVEQQWKLDGLLAPHLRRRLKLRYAVVTGA